MFIAHLPAGYLLTTFIQNKLADKRRGLMVTGLVASVLPDVDLIYSYFIATHRVKHHDYWTHVPLFWCVITLIGAVFIKFLRRPSLSVFLGVAFANVILHMVMDSIAAEIKWFYPFSDWELNLVKIPAGHTWWVWNFVLHWTFALEVLIIAAAAFVWVRARREV